MRRVLEEKLCSAPLLSSVTWVLRYFQSPFFRDLSLSLSLCVFLSYSKFKVTYTTAAAVAAVAVAKNTHRCTKCSVLLFIVVLHLSKGNISHIKRLLLVKLALHIYSLSIELIKIAMRAHT